MNSKMLSMRNTELEVIIKVFEEELLRRRLKKPLTTNYIWINNSNKQLPLQGMTRMNIRKNLVKFYAIEKERFIGGTNFV